MLYVYGALALTHIFVQMLLGHLHYRKTVRNEKKSRDFDAYNGIYAPSVGIIVPVYNEESDQLEDALEYIYENGYKGEWKAYVVDDGSKNYDEVEGVYRKYEEKAQYFRIIRQKNAGKRSAQVEALKQMARDGFKPEIVVTIDSDTIIEMGGLANIVQYFKDEKIGAVSGNVLAENKDVNILTKLINYRYWMAFNQERAAQSMFSVLMCCSGPFSAYRGRVIRGLADKYVKQSFFGKRCTYGDDRHLTNLVLEEGWKVVYASDAKAKTHVPTTIKTYLKQQLRWNKSFYREMLWTLKAVSKHNWYLIYDLAMQFILPFMLMGALVHSMYVIAFVDPWHAVAYAEMVMAIAVLRVSYGMIRTQDIGFYWFLIYGFFHVFVLIPNRLIALATINDGKWGTR